MAVPAVPPSDHDARLDEPAETVAAEPAQSDQLDDDAIRALVARLARPHRSGGKVVERATLLAEGADFNAVLRWIDANGGEPESAASKPASRGLHSDRADARAAGAAPLRFILPAAALS
jgi:hypothetical protein